MRILVLAGGVAAVGVLLAATALAAGAGGTSKTIRVVERATTDAVTETGKKGDSAGDLLTFANVLYNSSNTTSVGSDNGWCIRTTAGNSWECAWTNMLAGGQIMVTGPSSTQARVRSRSSAGRARTRAPEDGWTCGHATRRAPSTTSCSTSHSATTWRRPTPAATRPLAGSA